MSKYVRKKGELDKDTPRTQLSKQLEKVCHQFYVACHQKHFCRQNWVFPFVLPLETFQIEIRHQSKNSNPDHLQLLKVRIRIRLQVIQDVLRLLKILFCHQYMNSKYNFIIRVTHGVQFLVRKSVGKNSVSRVGFAS